VLLLAAAFGGRTLNVPAARMLIRAGDRLLGRAACPALTARPVLRRRCHNWQVHVKAIYQAALNSALPHLLPRP
jgi:hypothetical protein